MKTRQLTLVIAATAILLGSSAVKADEYYYGGVTVDIDRVVNGWLWVEDATVNLYKNAHIKNDVYYGDVFSASGASLNIYGGTIDGTLIITTNSNGMPEANVTVYGYGFAVDNVPVAADTPEMFIPNNTLSGFYEDGTPFAFKVNCYKSTNLYLTIKFGWRQSQPQMAVTPDAIDFGNVKLTESASQTVSVANTGTANLIVQSIGFADGSSAEFACATLPVLPMTLEPGAGMNVDVVFTPAATGPALAVMTIAGDNVDVAQVTLTGIGIKPVIAVEPAALDFGQLDLGQAAIGKLTIANTGDAQLIIQSMDFTDTSSADFAFMTAPVLPMVIEPNAITELEIAYTPTAEGDAAALLNIVSDDMDNVTVAVTMTGKAVNPVQTPLEQINAIVSFYDQGVKDKTIKGVGHNPKVANMYVTATRQMLVCTRCLIKGGYGKWAIYGLYDIDLKTDGKSRPCDIIQGAGVAELNAKIKTLIDTLKKK